MLYQCCVENGCVVSSGETQLHQHLVLHQHQELLYFQLLPRGTNFGAEEGRPVHLFTFSLQRQPQPTVGAPPTWAGLTKAVCLTWTENRCLHRQFFRLPDFIASRGKTRVSRQHENSNLRKEQRAAEATHLCLGQKQLPSVDIWLLHAIHLSIPADSWIFLSQGDGIRRKVLDAEIIWRNGKKWAIYWHGDAFIFNCYNFQLSKWI